MESFYPGQGQVFSGHELGHVHERCVHLNHTWRIKKHIAKLYQMNTSMSDASTGLILGLHPVNERRRYFVTTSLIGWAQA